HSTELWRSDGTRVGTKLVRDINPGLPASSPANLTDVAGTLFLSANDGRQGDQLWKSDGTGAGTQLVKDINPTGGSLTTVAGALFFTAHDPTHGTELWRSDGTAAGTRLAKDIKPGSRGSNPSGLTA